MTRKTCEDIRLYHVDHLGSTSLVTDIDGEITQHVAYIPYGEVFVEERNGSWSTPYLFNAKELDEETGLYYYGARYLDPTNATWLSVDPLFEKYVGMTPYNYCAGNPVKLVDVDGMSIDGESKEDWDDKKYKLSLKITDLNKKLSDKKAKLMEKEAKGKNVDGLKSDISTIEERLSYLNRKYDDMRKMEDDADQVYALRHLPDVQEAKLTMENGVIYINYIDDDNFFHESTHASQYMAGDFGWIIGNKPDAFFLIDIEDEIEAYKMQYAYSGAVAISKVNQKYVRGLLDAGGSSIYKNLPSMSIGKNSIATDLNRAYPNMNDIHKDTGDGDPNQTVGSYLRKLLIFHK